MIPRLWRFLRPFHTAFYTLAAMTVVYEFSSLVSSYTVSLIVQFFEAKVQYWVWLLVFLIAFIHGEFGMRLDNRFDWHIIAKQHHEIFPYFRIQLNSKILRLPASWHQKNHSGAVVGQVSDAIWKALEVIDTFSWEVVSTLVQILISLVPILFFSPIVGVVLICVFFVFIKLTIEGERKKHSLRKKRQEYYIKDWQLADELGKGWQTVVLFNQQEYLMAKFAKIQDKIKDYALSEHLIGIYKFNRMRIRLNINARLIFYLILVVQLYLHSIDVPTLIFISVLIERLLSNFWRFTRLIDRVYSNSAGIDKMLKLYEEPEMKLDGPVKKPSNPVISIQFKKVNFRYRSTGKGTLRDLSLDMVPGKITALVGPSGAGKTTITNLLLSLWEKESGEILIDGQHIEQWDKRSLRNLIAYVPQGSSVHIFDTTIGENIRFSNPRAPIEKVIEAAKFAGIHEFILSLPKGYRTKVGERGQTLSGGQMQRVALARAIFADAPVLILDEATNALDPITEAVIHKNLKTVFKNRTVIVIAHRLSTIKSADRIIVLQGGKKIQEGTHEELLTCKEGLYAKMVATQIK